MVKKLVPDCYQFNVFCLGMWSSSFYLGSFAGPTYSGILVDNFGFQWTTMLYFCIFCIMIAVDGFELAFIKKVTQNETKPGYQKIEGSTLPPLEHDSA